MSAVSSLILSPAQLAAEFLVLDCSEQAQFFNEVGKQHLATKPRRASDLVKWIASHKQLGPDGYAVLRDIALEILPELQGDDE